MRGSEKDNDKEKAVNGGAALLLKDVVREFLRNEYLPDYIISMNTPVHENGREITIEDLLPGTIDPSDEMVAREFEQFAKDHAYTFFRKMNQKEKVAFLARDLGVPMSHPVIMKLTGRHKTVLNQLLQDAVQKIAETLKIQYADEAQDSVRLLTVLTIQEVNQCAQNWGKSNKKYAQLISMGINQ